MSYCFRLGFCKHRFMHNECVEYKMEKFEFYKWNHICLIYEDTSNNDGSHDTFMTLYMNGERVNQGIISQHFLQKPNWVSFYEKYSKPQVYKSIFDQNGLL